MHSTLLSRIQNIQTKFETPSTKLANGSYSVHQIHSNIIVDIKERNQELCANIQADGIFSSKQAILSIQTADCIPVLCTSSDGKYIAAIHAGWRGVMNGILPEMIRIFKNADVNINDCLVSLGPSISDCCFEISNDLKMDFESKWSHLWKNDKSPFRNSSLPKLQFTPVQNGIWLDLKRIAMAQLLNSGVSKNNIESIPQCTYCYQENGNFIYASYRRSTHLKEASTMKRQWSWIQKTI